jgi:RNA polymerase-associated protein CTR9
MDATAGRSVDIELNNQEVITIDLDNLDPEPLDVIDLLRDGQPNVWVWTKVAAEYWNKGYVEAAEKIAQAGISCLSCFLCYYVRVFTMFAAAQDKNDTSMLSPVYALLANIHIAHARKAPKFILPDAREPLAGYWQFRLPT